MWASWEKKESGWQKKVVDYGNQALKRIPYEEWGLKSIPPLSARRKEDELSGKKNVEVLFPSNLIPEEKVPEVLKKLGSERQAVHKRRMIWSFIGMPITAPVALIPIVPNIPFFYLVFRAWSHWRALSGSKHIEFLLNNNLITPKPHPILGEIYSAVKRTSDKVPVSGAQQSTSTEKDVHASITDETIVLDKSSGKRIADALEVPELEMEIGRALWQVEKALKATEELKTEQEALAASSLEQKEKK